jgi:signal transduction histidine kinase
VNITTIPGGGGSGGLVAGLYAFLNATLHPCYKINTEYLGIDRAVRVSDLVVTGEGCIDGQTPDGKLPAEVARLAKSHNLPVIAISGMIGKDAEQNLFHGIDSFVSIMESPTSLSEALDNAPELLTRAAERVMRLVLVGHRLDKYTEEQSQTASQGLQLYDTLNSQFEMNISDNGSSEFQRAMTQELRTPLNLIMGYAAMVKDRLLGAINPDQEKALERVMKHSLEFFNTINGLLLQTTPVNGVRLAPEDQNWTDAAEKLSITPRDR